LSLRDHIEFSKYKKKKKRVRYNHTVIFFTELSKVKFWLILWIISQTLVNFFIKKFKIILF